MKKAFALILSTVLALGSNMAVYAEPEVDTPIDIEITEDYKYTANIIASVSITNNIATCNTVVRGFSGLATKVVLSHILQKKNGSTWSDVASWNKTFYSWLAMYQTTSPVFGSGTYRLKTVTRVYSGSNYETITVYSNTCTC